MNTLRTLVVSAGFCVALAAGVSVAAADVTERWVAVDEVAVKQDTNGSSTPALEVVGVLEGDSTITTRSFGSTNAFPISGTLIQRCERLALLALSRPGRYALVIVRRDGALNGFYFLLNCRLARVD